MIDPNKRKNGAGWNPAARSPATERRQKLARELSVLVAILRGYRRVVDTKLERLDGAARLAAGDARERLREFCDRCDTEKRKRA